MKLTCRIPIFFSGFLSVSPHLTPLVSLFFSCNPTQLTHLSHSFSSFSFLHPTQAFLSIIMRLSTVALFGLLATAAQFAKADDLQDEIDQAQKKFCNGRCHHHHHHPITFCNLTWGESYRSERVSSHPRTRI